MNRSHLQAYKSIDKATMSGRDIEAEVLTEAAARLRECRDNWEADDRQAKLDAALKFNQLIWSVFQGELIEESNPLPQQLKQDLLSLGVFVDKRTFETMAYPAPEKLTALIKINTNIAAGLGSSATVEGDQPLKQETEPKREASAGSYY